MFSIKKYLKNNRKRLYPFFNYKRLCGVVIRGGSHEPEVKFIPARAKIIILRGKQGWSIGVVALRVEFFFAFDILKM